MANVNIEVQARTDQALRNLNNLTKGAGGMMAAFKDDAAGALGVFGVSLTAVNQPLTLVADTLKQSITAAANWGDEMGDLAALTGQSVEETSRMAATFELVGIKGGTLTKVLKSLADDGINLNMRSLKELSAQYQKLQDPVEKNRFLFEHFGKSASDMAEIMGRSTEELDKLAMAANRSGKVIGGEAADAAEEFNVNLAIMQQNAEGAQISLGNALIPTLNKAFVAGSQLIQIWQMGNVKLREQRGEIDGATAALEMQRIAGIEPVTDATGELTTSTDEAAKKFDTFGMAAYGAATASFSLAVKQQEAAKTVQELKEAESDLATAIAGPIGKENENYIQQQAELRVKSRELKEELEKLEVSQGKQYTATVNGTMSASELTLAQLKLADAQKRLSEETDPLKQAALTVEVEKLTGKISGASVTTTGFVDNSKRIGEIKTELDGVNTAYDTNAAKHEEATARIVFGFIQQRMAADGLQDGEITALAKIGRAWGIYDEDTARALEAVDKSITEHGTNAAAIIGDVEKAIEGLPDTKEIVIQVRTNGAQIGDENFSGWTAPAGAAKSSGGGETNINGMRAMGGPVSAGGAYIVGEQGPELFVPRQSGTVVANGGGSDEALRAALLSLPASIARAVRDGMQMAAA